MVDELDSYIHSLIQVEKDKRAAEIHTLQMQINPHYIYNTLASIKWLIWQGDTQKTTGVIDAFIALLRNTISNTDEFVTVEQEIQNLKNYVLINQARYGDSVSAEFYVTPQCSSYRVPKLILQPFVENAFFHGFADGRRGKIQVFVKEEGDCLRFEIRDDGIGIKTERLMELKKWKRLENGAFYRDRCGKCGSEDQTDLRRRLRNPHIQRRRKGDDSDIDAEKKDIEKGL